MELKSYWLIYQITINSLTDYSFNSNCSILSSLLQNSSHSLLKCILTQQLISHPKWNTAIKTLNNTHLKINQNTDICLPTRKPCYSDHSLKKPYIFTTHTHILYMIATDIEINRCLSSKSPAFDHNSSSTLHPVMSFAIHLGKNLFECLIHAWQSSAFIFRHPVFIVSKRHIWSCGWWSYTFHICEEKTSFMGLRNGEWGTWKSDTIPGWSVNPSVTGIAWWNAIQLQNILDSA